MAPSALFQAFKAAGVVRITVHGVFDAPRAALRALAKGKRGADPGWFAGTQPGEGRATVAVSGYLHPAPSKTAKAKWHLHLKWFLTESGPPDDFQSFKALQEGLSAVFGEREVDVSVELVYDKERVISLFKPVAIGEQSQILDEIIGFTGVKRDAGQKTLYTLTINLQDTLIELTLVFRQTIKIEDNAPIPLIETARKIAALAVKPKETT